MDDYWGIPNLVRESLKSTVADLAKSAVPRKARSVIDTVGSGSKHEMPSSSWIAAQSLLQSLEIPITVDVVLVGLGDGSDEQEESKEPASGGDAAQPNAFASKGDR